MAIFPPFIELAIELILLALTEVVLVVIDLIHLPQALLAVGVVVMMALLALTASTIVVPTLAPPALVMLGIAHHGILLTPAALSESALAMIAALVILLALYIASRWVITLPAAPVLIPARPGLAVAGLAPVAVIIVLHLIVAA